MRHFKVRGVEFEYIQDFDGIYHAWNDELGISGKDQSITQLEAYLESRIMLLSNRRELEPKES